MLPSSHAAANAPLATSLLSLTLSSACLFPGLCPLWEWKIGVQFPVEPYSSELCFSDRATIALTLCEIKTAKFIPVSFVLLLGPFYTRYNMSMTYSISHSYLIFLGILIEHF